jgi:hypothetical protein
LTICGSADEPARWQVNLFAGRQVSLPAKYGYNRALLSLASKTEIKTAKKLLS